MMRACFRAAARPIIMAVLVSGPIGGVRAARADATPLRTPVGWSVPYLGPGRGSTSVTLGLQVWKDRLRIRNLIGRATVDVAPGIRLHALLRRREAEWSRTPFVPDVDESYVEGRTFYRGSAVDLAASMRIGRVRYLRFPAPDNLSCYDQVPGIADLSGGPVTDYRGAVLALEAVHPSGLGLHFTGIGWGFDATQHGLHAIEAYGFWRAAAGHWSLEGRAGGLAVRTEPLGRPARLGASAFVGRNIGSFEVGVMAERQDGAPTYTGVMVRFRPTAVTRALGTVGFDYTRKPESYVLQYDFLTARLGEERVPAPGETLVGEVQTVRLRTYWRQGYQRNEYEHQISAWGEPWRPGTRVVVMEQPWDLELEALVSPHTSPGASWLRDRQGPAQLAQRVVYRFYRAPDAVTAP